MTRKIGNKDIARKLLKEAANLKLLSAEDLKNHADEVSSLNEGLLLAALVGVVGFIGGILASRGDKKTNDELKKEIKLIDKSKEECFEKCIGTVGIEHEICMHNCYVEYYKKILAWINNSLKVFSGSYVDMDEKQREDVLSWLNTMKKTAIGRINLEANILNNLNKQKKEEEKTQKKIDIIVTK